MGSDIEQDIIALFDKNLKNVLTINKIASLLNKKYPYVHKKVNELITQGILQKKAIGKAHLCSLNLPEPRTMLALAHHELNKRDKLSHELKDFIEKILELKTIVPITCLVLHKKQTLYVVIEDNSKIMLTKERIEHLERINLSCEIIGKEDLKRLLLDQQTSLYSNHIILYGFERFFELIAEISPQLEQAYNPLLK